MRSILALLIFNLNFTCFCQEHKSLFERDCILANNVYKVVEYDPIDSIGFFERCPNGYYSYFDIYGRIVEANHYSGFVSEGVWIPGEFVNYYLYDSLDNQIGFIQIHQDMLSPFRFIELKSFDLEENLVKTVSLESMWEVNSNFIFDEKEIKQEKSDHDTVVFNPYHKRIYYNGDTTTYQELYLNKNGQIDSTVFYNICSGSIGKFECETRTVYEYFSNGGIKRISEQHYQILEDRKLLFQLEYFYLQNGLIDQIKSFHAINGRTDVRKFTYYYYKN